jgi:hypothetical protein
LLAYRDLINSRVQTEQTVWYNSNITVGAASNLGVSFLKQYYDIEARRIFPYLTAIIDADQGEVTGITWDDACVFCGSDQCQPIMFNYNGEAVTSSQAGQPVGGCYVSQEECETALATGVATNCDLTLYVVWTGTDKNGVAFQSAASRFSNFKTKTLKDQLSENLPQFGTTNNADAQRQRRW